MGYTKAQVQDSVKRVQAFITKNNKLPATVRVNKDTLQWSKWKSLPELKDAETRLRKWIKDNNQYPAYVNAADFKITEKVYKKIWTDLPKPTPTPSTIYNNKTFTVNQFKQDTNYYCGVNCLQLAILKLTGKTISEKTLASWCGTTTSGTSHQGLETGLKKFNSKYGFNLKMTWKNFSELTWKQQGQYLASKDSFLFHHLCYHNHQGSSYGKTGYGHYECLKQIELDKDTLLVYNSLSGGYVDKRSKSIQKKWCGEISQKSCCIISK